MNRLVVPAIAAGLLLALTATPALASHTHVMALGNGECVLLAANGGEEDVTLPIAVYDHNPNVDSAPAPGRLHPLHVLVHKGVPGDQNQLAVAWTAEAAALCGAGIVND